MKFRNYLLNHFFVFKLLFVFLGTLAMFYAYYFSDKPASFTTIKEHLNDPMMYICIIISLGISLGIIHAIFKKKMFAKR